MDFGTEVTLTALAKSIAGALVGLAIVAVLSVLWMRRLGPHGDHARRLPRE